MKTTIIFLGLAVLSFNNMAAKELSAQDLVQQDLAVVDVDVQSQSQIALTETKMTTLSNFNVGEEAAIFNPNTVIKSNYSKTLQEVVTEAQLVTEAAQDNYQPIALEMSMEDKIAESNQVIESTADNAYYPLDFEKINRTLKSNKVNNNNMAVPSDLKL